MNLIHKISYCFGITINHLISSMYKIQVVVDACCIFLLAKLPKSGKNIQQMLMSLSFFHEIYLFKLET